MGIRRRRRRRSEKEGEVERDCGWEFYHRYWSFDAYTELIINRSRQSKARSFTMPPPPHSIHGHLVCNAYLPASLFITRLHFLRIVNCTGLSGWMMAVQCSSSVAVGVDNNCLIRPHTRKSIHGTDHSPHNYCDHRYRLSREWSRW